MEEKEVILTQEGYDNLEKELNYLRTEKRAEIADRIKVALGFGDLSENSEYDEAKNAQAQNEIKIADLENKLRLAICMCDNYSHTNLQYDKPEMYEQFDMLALFDYPGEKIKTIRFFKKYCQT